MPDAPNSPLQAADDGAIVLDAADMAAGEALLAEMLDTVNYSEEPDPDEAKALAKWMEDVNGD